MHDHQSRTQALERRLEKDPASIAFAQLAEEYRRAGRLENAVAACRAGLAHHPAYLSARVTLGRALVELGRLDEAEREFGFVASSAPDSLPAVRGLADIEYRRGRLAAALERYVAALEQTPWDGELDERVREIRARILAAADAPVPESGATASAPAAVPLGPAASSSPKPTRVLDPGLHALPVLERWLDAILTDRQQRAIGRWWQEKTAEGASCDTRLHGSSSR